MDYLIVCAAALVAATVTLFSGFGLGTVLMPVFALFFPLPVAVAATAVVHLANNLFKLVLVGRHADRAVAMRFGVAAGLAAVFGAVLLRGLSHVAPLATYQLGTTTRHITLLKLAMAVVIVAFALFELIPRARSVAFDRRYLVLGGVLSGFFGGLSGHQGALRSAFLTKCDLSKEAFVGTGVVCAVIVDIVRLVVYGLGFSAESLASHGSAMAALTAAGSLAAFVGSYLGAKFLQKVTLETVRLIVGLALMLLGLALGAGVI